MAGLYKRHNYTSKAIRYLRNMKIREYDMQDAGFSLIKIFKLLPPEEIAEIDLIKEKLAKNIHVGKLLRDDPKLSRGLMDSFIKARQVFFRDNYLNESNVIAIKKDAIITTQHCRELELYNGELRFIEKNIFTSMYIFDKIEFYYNGFKNTLDIRGMSKLVVKDNELLTRLTELFGLIEKKNKVVLFQKLQSLREDYLYGEMATESYRELKSGLFKIDIDFGMHEVYGENVADKDSINNSYNYINIIMPLISLLI